MPETISKKPTKPRANLPDRLKTRFSIDRSSDIERQFIEKYSERLSELLTYYRIKHSDPNKWLLLSWFLANEFGLFRIATPPGRHGFWHIKEQANLLDEVNKIKANSRPRMSTSKAVADLLKTHPQKYPGLNGKTLENQYSEAKRRFARLVHALVETEDGLPEERNIRPTFNRAARGRPKIHPEN